MGDNLMNKIGVVLKNSKGLTITELVKKTGFKRSAVRIVLAKFEGADKVTIRKVGMAKIYFWGRK